MHSPGDWPGTETESIMQKSLIVLALAGALVGRELMQPVVAQGNGGILVLDIRQVIDDTKEGREIVGKVRAEMAQKKNEIELEVKKLQEQVKQLTKAKLPDKDKAWYDELKIALERQGTLKADEQYFIATLNDKVARGLNQILRGAKQEAEKIRKARGASVVLITRLGSIEVNNDGDLQDEVVFRRVLAMEPNLDITKDVITMMDKDFDGE